MARPLILFAAVVMLLLTAPRAAWSAIETVRIPVTIDSMMMRSLMLYFLYDPSGKKQVLDLSEQGCTRVQIGAPDVDIGDSLMRSFNTIQVQTGIRLFGTCFTLYKWEGYLGLAERVEFGAKGFKLKFPLVEYNLYNHERRKISLPWFVRDEVDKFIQSWVSQVSIDLGGPVRDLKAMLPDMFEGEDRKRINRSLKSLRPGRAGIEGDAIQVEMLMDVETQPKPAEPVAELTDEEIDRATKAWEPWDAFLVLEIRKLAGQSLEVGEDLAVLETLVDARQGFVQALADRTLGTGIVREQFVQAWKGLSSVLKRHLTMQPSPSLIDYMAFFTAADAITVLDGLGPALGMEISREGLVRLARLLVDTASEETLAYSYALDPGLREVIGFGPPLATSGPAFKEEEIEIPGVALEGGRPDRWKWSLFGFWVAPAYAAGEGPPAGWEALTPWLPPPEKDLPAYLSRVRKILDQVAEEPWSGGVLPDRYEAMFRLLVLATGWQESCWRQFVKTGGKVRYIVSYNQTSVGVMQINERVWRGIYALDSLRWDIHYNARAGKEILATYLTKYALKRRDPLQNLDDDTLARVSYAMYNGGPGQFGKFLERSRTGAFYDSDSLFWDKYQLVKQGRFDEIGNCFIGKPVRW